ncbi:hypothetical protein MC885_004115 [Smutsia gigantea]|nr:hypothetical protein MC885_004115 [Smutsia gigantea]
MVEDELALFDKSINEFWNKFKSTVSDTSCQMAGLRDTYKDSIKALTEKLSVKLKEEERMVEMFLEYQNPISTAKKSNEERLKRLQKSADLYKDRLGLEIRKIYGEKLQFIFTNIDPKHPESPFMFSLHLNDAREYEVSDCAPHLECLAEFQENVRKTNNFSAFLANIRKAFTAVVHNG